MALPNSLKFSCATLPSANGYAIKGLTPDENGCYDVVLGCVGAPTRANVIYEPESLVGCMKDPESRFNICLRDGNLFGEWGHPVIKDRKDMDRLMQIDEHYISHVFTKIWIDEKPITIKGVEGYPIRAKVKPCGPYGEVLEKSLRDPNINTAFSIRSLCFPSSGPRRDCEYRKVQVVVTFDAVNAPGFEMATKRYNTPGMESFEMQVNREELSRGIIAIKGMESCMITEQDLHRIFNEKEYKLNDEVVGTSISGKRSLAVGSHSTSAAALMYRGR